MGGAEQQNLTITVTNTFGAPPAPAPLPPPPTQSGWLPNTGAPVESQLTIAGLLLAAGMLLIATGRRRPGQR